MWRFMYRFLLCSIFAVLVDCACDEPLGLDFGLPYDQQISDDQLSASSETPYGHARYGRLNKPSEFKVFGCWCAQEDDARPWFQVDFRHMTSVMSVKIGTREYWSSYVITYAMMYSYDGSIWYNVTNTQNKTKVFPGITSEDEKRKSLLDMPITAQYFRIYPGDYEEAVCMQSEFYGCLPKNDCGQAVGISDRKTIPDFSMTSSSVYENQNPSSARLNTKPNLSAGQWGAWCPAQNDKSPWLQVDLHYVREISSLETQGHPMKDASSWVTSYTFNYSLNGIEWFSYGKNFTGNINFNIVKINKLANTVRARFIRFLPSTFNEMACMRVEVYECAPNKESIPKMVHGIKDAIVKRGESYALECKFGGQPGIMAVWHRNDKYMVTTDNRISTQERLNGNEITSVLHFTRIKSEEDGAAFSCIAWYPNLKTVHAQSIATIRVEAPIPYLSVINVTRFTATIFLNFSGPATSDVVGYHIRTSSPLHGTPIINELPFINSTTVNITGLRPYRNYTVAIAMLYIEKEIGEFYSQQGFQTLQDVPYGAPLNLRVEKLSHDSLLCKWDHPDKNLTNGIVTKYEVRYKKSVKEEQAGEGNKQSDYIFISNNQTSSLTLSSLEPGAIFEITVRAYTIVGAGPFVEPPTLMFTGKATEELNKIKQLVVTDDNAVSIGIRLKNITSNQKFLNKYDVVLTLDILEKVVKSQNTSELIGEPLVEAVSNVLKANKTVLAESEITNRTGTRYVRMLEKWLEGVDAKDKELEEESENVVVQKVYINRLKILEEIKFRQADLENSVEMIIPKEAITDNNTDSIYFVYYKKNKFFQGDKRLEELCINGFTVIKERIYTPVISGEVVGRVTTNLSAPVVLKFKQTETVAKLGETACAYWDYEADNKKGGWSTKGCKLESIVNQTITCHCNHLTNFAAMMDVYAQTSMICGKHQRIISFITVIGCFLSLIGLFFTFLTYFMFRKLLKEMAAKVLIQLCAALFIVVLTFVTGIEQTDKPMMCMTVAFVLHYFTLVTFMWMLMEASFMYHAFVRVWPPRQGGDIYRSTIIAWGIPIFIVGITFLTSMDNYGGENYCHLTGHPLYFAYLMPIGLIIFINFILFIFIMRKLSSRPNNNTDQTNSEAAVARVRRAFGVMILMGLTWAFGFGSASGARLEFTYLFAVFNASQGFAIFIFYVLAQKRARSQWWAFFTCDNRSENKRNTDSYYFERGRMSSTISSRTNTMQFNRLNSNASSVLVSSGSTGQHNTLLNKSPMNTIDEIESPSKGTECEPDYPMVYTDSLEKLDEIPIVPIDETDLNESNPEEDELLNQKIQDTEDDRKAINDKVKGDSIRQYSSYRALSGAKSYDVLNLVKTPSGKNIEKGTPQRKSNEMIHRKSNEWIPRKDSHKDKRRSMIDTMSIASHPTDNIRIVKSLEHINDREVITSEIPSEDIDLTGYKIVDSTRNLSTPTTGTITGTTTDTTSLGHREAFSSKTDRIVARRSSDVEDVDKRPLSQDTGTLKSDAATMTDNVPPTKFRPPLSHIDGRSKEDIMEWLENCNDDPKDSDSDYSSSFYKTSRSSSMTDMSNTRHTSTTSNNTAYGGDRRKGFAEKQLQDNIMGPLKGHNGNSNSRNGRKRPDDGVDQEIESDFSEQGYSASEEDIFNLDNSKSDRNNKPKKKKSKTRSTGFIKPSGYMTLDDPTSHASYV